MIQTSVTVIVPTYGPPTRLSQALDSVFAQTRPASQVIVVDDNDPVTPFRRATEDVVSEQRSKGRELTFIQHASNRNGAAARNTGLQAATGDVISFLDSDDFYLPRRLEIMCEVMESAGEEVAGVYSGVEFRRGGRVFGYFDTAPSGNFLVETLACRFKIGSGSNIFVRRAVIDELGGFDESFWRHQDYEFLVRLFQGYRLEGVDEVLLVKNNENLNFPNFSHSLAIKEQYLDKYRPVIEAQGRTDRDFILRSNYVSMGELALKEGLRAESRAMFRIALDAGPLTPRQWLRRLALWTASWLR